MPLKDYREQSRINLGTEAEQLSRDQITLGCLLRIADATEKMAQFHTELILERDSLRNSLNFERAFASRLKKQNAALRGIINSMKRKAKSSQ